MCYRAVNTAAEGGPRYRGASSRSSRGLSPMFIVDGSVRAKPGVANKLSSDLAVAARLGVTAPMHRVTFARIRMLTRILIRGRTDILTILWEGRTSARSWLTAVEADLAMFAGTTDKLAVMRGATIDRWIAFFLKNGGACCTLQGACAPGSRYRHRR